MSKRFPITPLEAEALDLQQRLVAREKLHVENIERLRLAFAALLQLLPRRYALEQINLLHGHLIELREVIQGAEEDAATVQLLAPKGSSETKAKL